MKRKDVQESLKWKLSDIYESEDEFVQEMNRVKVLAREIADAEGTLSTSAQHLFEVLEKEVEVSILIERIYTYAALVRDEDTENVSAQARFSQASMLAVQAGTDLSFLEPEMLEMDEQNLFHMCERHEGLNGYKRIIENMFRSKKHCLSKEKEEILSITSEMSSVPGTVFNLLNDADIIFPKVTNEKGEDIVLTHSSYSELMDSTDRKVRKEAYRALYTTYKQYKNTIAALLYANIKKNVMYAKTRKYDSVLESALFANDVNVDVYNNLITTVGEHLQPMYEYLEIRKNMLQVENLHMYDLYTPLVPELKKELSYEEAYAVMLEGLAPLGEDYITTLKRAKVEGWIDVQETEGKRSGAYQWGPYGTHPYVLLNHQSNIDSMFTLAHEMGHAMHSYYSDKANSYPYAQYTIFVAEVASTVNEVLLMHHLLKSTKDKEEKKYLIDLFLEKFRGTLFRQTMFAEFEKETHSLVEKGVPLTSKEFSELYAELNEKYYGEVVVQDEHISYEWMRIPHFYNSFYVYQYATGFSAAIAIAQAILTDGDVARDAYLTFLQSGGTDFPIELLKIAGIDMSKPKPIEDALEYFDSLVKELKRLQ